jgi:hypothetical protein
MYKNAGGKADQYDCNVLLFVVYQDAFIQQLSQLCKNGLACF